MTRAVGIAVALVVTGPLHAGFEYVLIRRIRGEQVAAGDVFAGFSIAFLQLFLTHLISALLTAVGICLCLIPGIYLAVSYLFALPLAIDKRMEFWTAMEVSRQVVQRHWWSMFAYAIVMVLMLGAGTLMCLVGLIVAVPVAVAGLMYIYEDLFGGVAA